MPKKIRLSYSCNKSWDSMDSSEQGKYCSSCDHDVLDLTLLGYQQIQDKLATLEKGACIKISEAYAEREKGYEINASLGLKSWFWLHH